MPLDANAKLVDAEQAELERVVEALARWPRPSHLLRYMGEKLNSGEVDDLNEYNIATEVLGRSKTVFNAGEDAIARVETHRLRKRLAEFYETDGKDHPIQVTLPAGSYAPVFIYKPAEDHLQNSPVPPPTSESESRSGVEPLSRGRLPGWKYWASSACLVVIGLGLYLSLRAGAPLGHAARVSSPVAALETAPLQPGVSSPPIRVLAGYSGPPRMDSAGRIWNADQYFIAGSTWQRDSGFVARTSDPFLFEHSRTGDFSYKIPLKPGSYELHLFFSTPFRSNEAISTFTLSINGKSLLQGFDINMDAMGENIADERVFRDVFPGQDGFLLITFSGEMGPPSLNALEILPSVHNAQLPTRLVMQSVPLTDRKGQLWHPDDYFMNGRLSNQTHPLLDSPDRDLFSGERFGHFSYAIPVDTRGTYTLILHFAEFYFTAAGSASGRRIFKVMCNGQTLLDDFDIFREAGLLHEVTKSFRHLQPTAQGKLNIVFEPIVNNATVSGIEVLDESQ